MSSTTTHLIFFRRLTLITLIAVYLLIVIGSGVRVSGAGMGCPDWPTCFGKLIPPVSVHQLPENYREIYADRGYANQPFNAVKTWIEFGNRLSGVTFGLLITSLFIVSFFFLRSQPRLIIISGIALLLTSFQGWLGSIVVSSNLHPLIISSHMLLALIIIAILHTLLEVTKVATRVQIPRGTSFTLVAAMFVLLVQIALGLGVREQIDSAYVLFGVDSRQAWIDALDNRFLIHTIVGASIFAIALSSLWFINHREASLLSSLSRMWFAALCGSLCSGLIMWLFAIPAVAQPLHLLFASLQFGLIYHMLFRALRSQSPHARRA